MKRKLAAAVSIGSAICMSFFMFACNGDDNKRPAPEKPDPDPVPVVLTPRDKLEDGVTALYDADGFSGTLSATTRTDANGQAKYNYSYVKKGNKLAATGNDEQFVLDLDTGYRYQSTEDGVTFSQDIAAGWYGYAAAAFKAEFPDKLDSAELDGYITETDGKVKIAVDLKADVNKYLELLSDCYTGTLYDVAGELLNEIYERGNVPQADRKTVDALLDETVGMITENTEKSATFFISMINTQLRNLGIKSTIEDFFINAGVSKEDYANVSKRKVGEMAAGALTYIDDLVDGAVDFITNNGADEENAFAVDAQELFDAMFVNPIAQEKLDSLEADVENTKDKILNLIKTTAKVKTLVDLVVDKTGIEDIRTAIANAVMFTKLNAEFTVSFADDGSISKIEFSAAAAHNYVPTVTQADAPENDADTAAPSIFADNNYSVYGAVTFDVSSVRDVDIPGNLGGLGESVDICAVAGASDTAVYIETGSEQANVVIDDVATDATDKNGNDVAVDKTGITFDSTASTLTIPTRLIESVRPTDGVASLYITGTVNGKPLNVTVYVPGDYSLETMMIIRNA